MATSDSSFIIKSTPFGGSENTFIEDYEYAMVHLAWCIADKERYLIFGMIEGYPKEITSFCESAEQTVSFRKKSNIRLFYTRKKILMKEAIGIYKAGFSQNSIPLIWDKTKAEKPKHIYCGEMLTNLRWPNLGLVISDIRSEYPFIPTNWRSVRIHQLFPSIVSQPVMELLEHKNPVEWLENRLMFNLNKFGDLLGSLQLVLPNPVYRKLNHRLIPGVNGSPDQVQLEFKYRENKSEQKLVLYSIEKLRDIYTTGHEIELKANQIAFLPLNGVSDKIATLVRCKKRGIIDYHPFAGFIKRISANLFVTTTEKKITVPGTGEQYNTTVYEKMSVIEVGDDNDGTPELELGQNIGAIKLERKKRTLAAEFGQKIFWGDQDEAKSYVRELVRRAQNRLIIVDPYFSTVELFNYVYALCHPVDTTIVSSALALKGETRLSEDQNPENAPPVKQGLELYDQLNQTNSSIKVFVMTGKQPVIHDRYLIIDDNVWLSGNSLNALGVRLSTIIKLPDPSPLISEVEKILSSERVLALDKWIKNCNDQKKE